MGKRILLKEASVNVFRSTIRTVVVDDIDFFTNSEWVSPRGRAAVRSRVAGVTLLKEYARVAGGLPRALSVIESIGYGGMKHLRMLDSALPWYYYYNFDIILVYGGTLVIILYSLLRCVRCCWRCSTHCFKRKVSSQSKQKHE